MPADVVGESERQVGRWVFGIELDTLLVVDDRVLVLLQLTVGVRKVGVDCFLDEISCVIAVLDTLEQVVPRLRVLPLLEVDN